MSQILRRPAATEDIAEHWDWMAEQDLAAADRWLDRLEASLQTWASRP
jgi:plasmid stabilization system protein ParE